VVQIIHVRVPDPAATDDTKVSSVNWYNPESGATNAATVPAMADWIKKGGRAYACDGKEILAVVVADSPTPHLRLQKSDGTFGSLLKLPKF